MEWINYHSRKQILIITEDTETIVSECTSISFQNKGTIGLELEIEGTKTRIESEDGFAFSNDPDVREKTEFRKIVFDSGIGVKSLLVIKEFVTPAET